MGQSADLRQDGHRCMLELVCNGKTLGGPWEAVEAPCLGTGRRGRLVGSSWCKANKVSAVVQVELSIQVAFYYYLVAYMYFMC